MLSTSSRATSGLVESSQVDRAAGMHPSARRLVPPPLDQTHGGLDDLDPWIPDRTARPRRQSQVATLWPWGLRGVADSLEVVALALLMFILVRGVAQNFVVDGGSMEPTFSSGQMLIVNKLAYSEFDVGWVPSVGSENWRPFGEVEQGDVIVFRFPLGPSRDFIKRIVALPGQTVEVRDEQVIVDGVVLLEPYLDDLARYPYGPETVPGGHLFVLGDARNNSYDSHSWGMLDQSLIIGRVELRYWPVDRAGMVGRETPSAAAGVQ